MSHYETLKVARDASPAEIKAAWRRASAAAHPDREGGSTERQQAVNRAYEVLSDPERRGAYDATGVDAPQPTVEDEARQAFVQMLSNLIVHEGDLLAYAASVVEEARSQLIDQVNVRKTMVARLSSRCGKVRRKHGIGENLVEQLLEERAKALDQELQLLEKGLRVNAALRKLLDGYENEPSEPAAGDGQANTYTIPGGFWKRSPWRKA